MVVDKTYQRLKAQLKERLASSPTPRGKALAKEALTYLKAAVEQLRDPKERFILKRAADLDFMDDLGTRRFSLGEFRALRIIGRIGHASRGVVLPIIGYSLARAAFVHDPNQAQGTGGAVAELAQTSWILLALIAVGLMAYGVLNLVFARVRCAQVHV